MEQNMESEGSRTGVATNVIEAIIAFILLVGGSVVVYQAVELGHRWGSDGPGPGYFPFYIGLIIVISSAVILFQAVAGKNKNTEVFVDHEQLKRVLAVLIPAAIYVLAIQFLGIYIASAIYITLFMTILGKFSIIKSVLVGVLVNVVFFLMFEVWFKVPLFKGEWDLLAFLGY